MGAPFESTYASSFIFALGYIAKAEGLELGAAWAMSLAQSPADTSVGDMILGWTGRKYIFEFKRSASKVRTELEKPEKHWLLQFLGSAKAAPYRAVAERGHFLAYGETQGTGGLRFFPYPFVGARQPPRDKIWDASAFIKNVLFNADYGFSSADFGAYLRLLDTAATKVAQTSSAGSAGGRRFTLDALVVSYDREARRLCFMELDLLDRRRSLENELTLSRGIARGADRDEGLSR